MRKRPPHIVVTTPESLYVLLGSESGRKMLATTRTVIVDEIHALRRQQARQPSRAVARAARRADACEAAGAHRAVRDAEADRGDRALPGRRSADERPKRGDCAIVDAGHVRQRDLAHRGAAVAARSGDVGRGLGAGLRAARRARRASTARRWCSSTRGAWPSARRAICPSCIGAEHVDVAPRQHGEGAAAQGRAAAEARRAARCWSPPRRSSSASTSATSISSASSARRARSRPSCSARAARATRSAACRRRGSSRCRATSWSSARRCSTRCAAASSTGCAIPRKPLDVLAQQIVAEVAAARVDRGRAVRRSCGAPTRTRSSTRDEFLDVVRMLAEGFTTRRGHRAAYIHRDAVNGVLRGRRGARLTALTSGGAIPDNADYDVVLEPAEPARRHGQRGLRDREPRRRHLPARQHVVSDPARRGGPRARRGCARPAADDSVLARRGAGAHRRAVARGVAAARGGRRAARRRGDERPRSSVVATTSGIARRGRGAARRLSRRRARGARRAADAARRSCSSASSTSRAACSSSSTRRSAAGSTAPGGSRCASASAASSTSSCRRRRPRTRSCCRCRPATASRSTAVARYLHSNTRARRCWSRRCSTRRCSRARWRWIAGDRARAAALPRRQEGARRRCSGCAPRTCWRRCSPTRSPAPRTSSASARSRTIRWSTQTMHDCLHEAMDIDGLERLLRGIEAGDDRDRRARPDRAVAARATRS